MLRLAASGIRRGLIRVPQSSGLRAAPGRVRHARRGCLWPQGTAETTFYLWKKKSGSLIVSEVRERRQRRGEDARWKRLVADLTHDEQILHEVIRKQV